MRQRWILSLVQQYTLSLPSWVVRELTALASRGANYPPLAVLCGTR